MRVEARFEHAPDYLYAHVFLDGEELGDVVMADTTTGVVAQVARGERGEILTDGIGNVATNVRRGKVEVRWDDGWPRNPALFE